MICPMCGQEERQDRKMGGHAWHMPLVLTPGTQPAACDCEGAA
jgi:hypothetical protein